MRKPVQRPRRNPSEAKLKLAEEFRRDVQQLSDASRRSADRLLSADEVEEELARRRGGR